MVLCTFSCVDAPLTGWPPCTLAPVGTTTNLKVITIKVTPYVQTVLHLVVVGHRASSSLTSYVVIPQLHTAITHPLGISRAKFYRVTSSSMTQVCVTL